jgi:hypothetical protein
VLSTRAQYCSCAWHCQAANRGDSAAAAAAQAGRQAGQAGGACDTRSMVTAFMHPGQLGAYLCWDQGLSSC